jgi:NDP-sugar pyrophosphorylase family protein
MAAFQVPGYLLDIGTPEKYAYAQQTWPGFPSVLQGQEEGK